MGRVEGSGIFFRDICGLKKVKVSVLVWGFDVRGERRWRRVLFFPLFCSTEG